MKKTFLALVVLIATVGLVLVVNVQPAFAIPTVTTHTTTVLSAPENGSIKDTATVTGSPGYTPTGTVTFKVSTDGGPFTAYGANSGVVTLVNGVAISDSFPIQAGSTYYFKAFYSGDAFDSPSQSGDTDEPYPGPGGPAPELPAGMLFGLGLLGVGGFVLIKRHRRAVPIK